MWCEDLGTREIPWAPALPEDMQCLGPSSWAAVFPVLVCPVSRWEPLDRQRPGFLLPWSPRLEGPRLKGGLAQRSRAEKTKPGSKRRKTKV